MPKLRYSKTEIKGNSAAAPGKKDLGSVILLHMKGKTQESGQGRSF